MTPNDLETVGLGARRRGSHRVVTPRSANGLLLDPEEIARAITDRTRMISVCNPNNPTCSSMSLEQMQAVVELARKHDLYLHADEVYKGSELFAEEGPSFADLYQKALVTNGLSKAMAMPGLRLGWLIAPEEDTLRAWHCKDYTSITTGALSEFIACRVLEETRRAQILRRSKNILRANLATITQWINAHADLLSFIPPKAGGMAFVRYQMAINSTELVGLLVREKGVFPVPGDAFGLDHYVRIGIGSTGGHLEEGLRRIDEFRRSARLHASPRRADLDLQPCSRSFPPSRFARRSISRLRLSPSRRDSRPSTGRAVVPPVGYWDSRRLAGTATSRPGTSVAMTCSWLKWPRGSTTTRAVVCLPVTASWC